MDVTQHSVESSGTSTSEDIAPLPEPESVAVDLTSICRICYANNQRLISMFRQDARNNHLVDKINTYLPIMVTPRDGRPMGVCRQCYNTILNWHEVVQRSLETEKKLAKWLNAPPKIRLEANYFLPENAMDVRVVRSPEVIREDIPTDISPNIRSEGHTSVSRPGPGLVRCNVCDIDMIEAEYELHLAEMHSTTCIYCDDCRKIIDATLYVEHVVKHAIQKVNFLNVEMEISIGKLLSRESLTDSQEASRDRITEQGDEENSQAASLLNGNENRNNQNTENQENSNDDNRNDSVIGNQHNQNSETRDNQNIENRDDYNEQNQDNRNFEENKHAYNVTNRNIENRSVQNRVIVENRNNQNVKNQDNQEIVNQDEQHNDNVQNQDNGNLDNQDSQNIENRDDRDIEIEDNNNEQNQDNQNDQIIESHDVNNVEYQDDQTKEDRDNYNKEHPDSQNSRNIENQDIYKVEDQAIENNQNIHKRMKRNKTSQCNWKIDDLDKQNPELPTRTARSLTRQPNITKKKKRRNLRCTSIVRQYTVSEQQGADNMDKNTKKLRLARVIKKSILKRPIRQPKNEDRSVKHKRVHRCRHCGEIAFHKAHVCSQNNDQGARARCISKNNPNARPTKVVAYEILQKHLLRRTGRLNT